MTSPAPNDPAKALARANLRVVQIILFVLAALYAGSLDAPFVFDDLASIQNNESLRSVWTALSPPGGGVTVQGRPVLNLSFALNQAFTGLSPLGFRLTNVALHAISALLLYGIVRRTLASPRLGALTADAAVPVASLAALLWAVHPLQTESVTYVVQRAESLMGLFYLLTLYGFIRSVSEPSARSWPALAVGACLLGMGTKEVMATAPIIVALYDRCFVASTWREVWSRRKGLHLALASTWLLLGGLILFADQRGGTAEAGLGMDLLSFWATQPRAIITYLRLSIWPSPQIFDYGTWPVQGAMDVLPYAVAVAGLAAATLWAWWRGARPLGFAGLWFFAVLAPTSLVPIPRQTVVEHRMYLALAPLAAALAIALHRRFGRKGLFAGMAAVVALGGATVARNADYRTPLALWEDTVAKKPDNFWARNNLGLALADAGRPAEALAQYDAAAKLEPRDAVSHFNAGNALAALDREAEAITRYAEAVRLAPAYTDARYNLGLLMLKSNRIPEAVRELSEVAAREPGRAEAQANAGLALARAGRTDEAVAKLTTALRLKPDYPEATYNLATLYLQTRRWAEAATSFESVVRQQPNLAKAHANLALARIQLGRLDAAIDSLHQAARLEPSNAEVRANLGALYAHLGKNAEAEAALTEALRLNPNHPAARQGLEQLRAKR